MTRPLSIVPDEPVDEAGEALMPAVGRPARTIGELRMAFAMLTRVPVGASADGTGVRAHAVVGAALGLAALVPLAALGTQAPTIAAILAVALFAILSGGLHLDGLADTFDALAAVGPEASERARRDPAIGAAGFTALILVIALDVALLAGPLIEVGPLFAGLACVAAGSVSRSTPAVLAQFARSAAGDEGLAAWFVRRVDRLDAAIGLASAALLSLGVAFVAASVALLVAGILGLIVSVVVGLTLVRLRGRLDGDVLGASVQLGFTATLATIALLATAAASMG